LILADLGFPVPVSAAFVRGAEIGMKPLPFWTGQGRFRFWCLDKFRHLAQTHAIQQILPADGAWEEKEAGRKPALINPAENAVRRDGKRLGHFQNGHAVLAQAVADEFQELFIDLETRRASFVQSELREVSTMDTIPVHDRPPALFSLPAARQPFTISLVFIGRMIKS